MTFSSLLFLTILPYETIISGFKYNVNLLYSFRLSHKVPPKSLIDATNSLFLQLKETLPEGYTAEEGFSWSRGPDYFVGKQSERGRKETVVITGEKITFNYIIYDEVIIPFFENLNRYDGTVIKAWVDENNFVHVLRNEYYREAEKIWNKEVLNPFARELLLKEYGSVIAHLKEHPNGVERFKKLYFERETSDMNLPEETFHIRFRDSCEGESEVLARLHRLWFNPTYSFLSTLIISAGKLPSSPRLKWVNRAKNPHRFAARKILYLLFHIFKLSSYRDLVKIPREDLSTFAEREFFEEISRRRDCFPSK